MRAPLLIGLCALMIASGGAAQTLVLHNTLDSDVAVLNSVVGPPLVFYAGGNRPYATIVATRAYVPGVSSSAFTLGPGPYESNMPAHAIELPNPGAVLNPEHGTIEVWYLSKQELAPYVNNAQMLFGQSQECAYEAGMALYVNHPEFWSTARVVFTIKLCGASVDAMSIVDGLPGHPLVNMLNQWIHFAAVWDRAGIAGTADRVRLYVNGELVAKTVAASWGPSFGPVAAVAGGRDWDIAGKFYVDELKAWDRAKLPIEPRATFHQPGGSGTALYGTSSNLVAGHEYFNLFSGDWAPNGLGTGPWGGLYFSDLSFLIFQLQLPVGAVPVHFVAPGVTAVFGPHFEPIGLTFESICVDVTGGVVGPMSPAVRFSVY